MANCPAVVRSVLATSRWLAIEWLLRHSPSLSAIGNREARITDLWPTAPLATPLRLACLLLRIFLYYAQTASLHCLSLRTYSLLCVRMWQFVCISWHCFRSRVGTPSEARVAAGGNFVSLETEGHALASLFPTRGRACNCLKWQWRDRSAHVGWRPAIPVSSGGLEGVIVAGIVIRDVDGPRRDIVIVDISGHIGPSDLQLASFTSDRNRDVRKG